MKYYNLTQIALLKACITVSLKMFTAKEKMYKKSTRHGNNIFAFRQKQTTIILQY